jgi:ketosteroid isomerase-like protein
LSSNIDLVGSLYDAFDRRDQAAVAAAMDHPEVEFRQTEQLPWGGHYKGFPDGVHQFFSKLLAHVESKVDVECIWEAGNAVIDVGRTRGRVRASGKAFDVSIAHVWRIHNRKIVSFEPHIDCASRKSGTI